MRLPAINLKACQITTSIALEVSGKDWGGKDGPQSFGRSFSIAYARSFGGSGPRQGRNRHLFPRPSKEFVTRLEEKGWRAVEPAVWTSPMGHEPVSTFPHLSRSLTPRSVCGNGLCLDILVFKRRRDLGEAVWVIG